MSSARGASQEGGVRVASYLCEKKGWGLDMRLCSGRFVIPFISGVCVCTCSNSSKAGLVQRRLFGTQTQEQAKYAVYTCAALTIHTLHSWLL